VLEYLILISRVYFHLYYLFQYFCTVRIITVLILSARKLFTEVVGELITTEIIEVKADFLEREAVLSLFMVTFDLLTIRKGS
jgi:hypothetical protein